MCWKQEWAAAIGNIQDAIGHIDEAEKKLVTRYEKNLVALSHHSGRNWDKFEARKILARIQKNQEGIAHCKMAKSLLRQRQDHLYWMISEFGIVIATENRRLVDLMHGYNKR